jgi:peptide/nickel transport system substrate-binding protein
MRNRNLIALTALAGAVGLAAAACGSSSTSKSSGSPGGAAGSAVYNAALTGVVNPSTSTTGTVTFVNASDFQSADPGNTYDASDWDFQRLYYRSVLSFTNKPGATGLQLEGDLGTGPGTHNADDTQWTYHIVDNAKFQDGTTITTADIKYAIERSNWGHDTLSNGPQYFKGFVQDTTNYKGPYADKNASDGVSGIQTPNATTIVFTLKQSVSDFDYLMTLAQTAPVEQSKDTGLTYANHVQSTGAYEIQSYTPGQGGVLVPNPNFVPASDPNHLHTVHASKIVFKVGQPNTTVDQDLLHGDAQSDLSGVGVQSSTQGQVLANPALKANSDNPETGFMSYLSINTQVTPFNNLMCRQAVEYAINKVAVQTVMGGSVGGGSIATTIIPPVNTGYVQNDVYKTPGEEGNPTLAKQDLATCQTQLQSSGKWSSSDLSFEIGAFSDQPKTVDAANVEAQELKAVGFNPSVSAKPFNKYYNDYGGLESYTVSNRLAMSNAQWGADFPDGYGFLNNILTSAGIAPSGGSTNLSYWDDPKFDSLMNTALKTNGQAGQTAAYGAADKYAMEQAVMVPLLYSRDLTYRPTNATNVYVSEAYGMYDFAAMGASN